MSELIRFQNGGVLVEVARVDSTKPVAGSAATAVQGTFDAAIKAIEPVLAPIREVVDKMMSAKGLKKTEFTLGLGLTVDGGIFVVKAKGEANFEVTLTFESA